MSTTSKPANMSYIRFWSWFLLGFSNWLVSLLTVYQSTNAIDVLSALIGLSGVTLVKHIWTSNIPYTKFATFFFLSICKMVSKQWVFLSSYKNFDHLIAIAVNDTKKVQSSGDTNLLKSYTKAAR